MKHIDSQEMLARSIARAVQDDLSLPQQRPEIAPAVEAALQKEARASERTLAAGRVVALLAYALLAVGAAYRPALLGLPAMPTANVWAALVWLAAAIALLLALRRGMYHRHMRRFVPAADAVGITLVVLLLDSTLEPRGAPPGAAVVAATMCALVAFSGSLRLSRRAARSTTAIAVIAAVITAAAAGLRPLEIGFIAAAVLVTGLLSNRLTRVIRRVITNEIARVQLARLYDDAREAAEAREEVLKIVSHDLRNPINTIGMAAELISDTSTDTTHMRTAAMIRRSAAYMNRMIQDLLDVAKLESGRLAIEVESMPVTRLMDEAVEMLAPLATGKQITLELVIGADVPAVCVDRGRILQVLNNLVGNAIKFTPAGGRITLHVQPAGDAVRCAVIDTGPGIPPDQLQRVFGRFWQATPSDRRGLGLGLTIAKSIVEAHGGHIGAESRPGEGTEFWFTVPADRA
jgi:signal transduction histidine kinase